MSPPALIRERVERAPNFPVILTNPSSVKSVESPVMGPYFPANRTLRGNFPAEEVFPRSTRPSTTCQLYVSSTLDRMVTPLFFW
ncbi:hypothetical protein NPIL_367601 [Nephila pilipes]|uniref:Uncharacterized protein n=1 Tax=Nephila pilipes TaxID=299642 RepID=A0A8X6TAN2_NEPPI|nr:hypothetical protein NPIL_367601 [Nephila pilipes]